ncbi:MAG: beta-ketoacyl-[acyl-carrier-protein] synthase family protein [Byssovorax sp.]
MRHRVAVTGMGVVAPGAGSARELRDRLLAGLSGVGPITIFDPASLPTRIAGEARLPARFPLRDRKIAFALEAARQAWEQASAPGTRPAGDDASASMGVGLELFAMEDLVRSETPGFALPDGLEERLGFMQTPSDLCVHLMAREYGLGRPPVVHVSACAAGTDAVGSAARMIAEGRRRWMMAGGTDSMLNPLGVAGFCALNATTTRNDEPGRASRPFDRTRDGFVMGEGAGVLVLERLDDALARGAPVLAEIAGYGSSFDAHGISEPHPEGRGAYQAMQRALDDAGIDAGQIDYVNAHGTGTPKNDPAETLALKRLLGDRAQDVPVSSTKSMIGHLISAAGAVEAIASILCMTEDMVHPTINLHEPDPACDLDYVPGKARPRAQRYVLSSSFGFGGQNASIVIRNGRDALAAR